MMEDKKLEKYPSTKKFKVIDTIGVPHPYCITPKHLLPDRMYLDIEEAERQGAVCDICRKRNRVTGEQILPFSEHKQALLVEVDDDRELKDVPGLKSFLLGIKDMAEKDGFVGFAFIQKKAKDKLKEEVV